MVTKGHSGPREAAWDLYGPRLEPDRRKLEIKSWVQLHHLELMKSCGRSVARSIAKSQGDGDLARHGTAGSHRSQEPRPEPPRPEPAPKPAPLAA